MENPYSFSEREREVSQLLAQGLGNREIAARLHISERTVEFHLTHIYEKMRVSSRAEAIVRLREPTGPQPPNHGDSTVVGGSGSSDNRDGQNRAGSCARRLALHTLTGGLIAAMAILIIAIPTAWESYARECENPEGSTVGQTIARPNASEGMVHGQFGVTGSPPWPAQPGSVIYKNIELPETDALYLKLQYSKYSTPTVPILVYLDDEINHRAVIDTIDMHSWDAFTETGPILLGPVKRGLHSIKFATQGQTYGVADLDQFVLLVKVP